LNAHVGGFEAWASYDVALEPRLVSREGKIALTEAELEGRAAELAGEVAGFFQRRGEHAFASCCLMDGAEIPIVADGILCGAPMKVTWCFWCEIGFVSTFDERYSWRLAETFVYDAATRRYRVDDEWKRSMSRVSRVELDALAVEGLLRRILVPPPHRGHSAPR
jgi:hypothetical protein